MKKWRKFQSQNVCRISVQNEMPYLSRGRIRTLKLLSLRVMEMAKGMREYGTERVT